MKNNNENIDKIFDLLQTKNYSELNIEDKKIVNKEFNSLKETLLIFTVAELFERRKLAARSILTLSSRISK